MPWADSRAAEWHFALSHVSCLSQVYQIYAKRPPEEVHALLRALGADYVILEDSVCYERRHQRGCRLRDLLDVANGHVSVRPRGTGSRGGLGGAGVFVLHRASLGLQSGRASVGPPRTGQAEPRPQLAGQEALPAFSVKGSLPIPSPH